MRSRKTAFTLAELLIVLGLTALMSAILAGIYDMGRVQYMHQSGRIGMSRLARQTVDRISEALAQAVPTSVDQAIHQASGSTIRFSTTTDLFSFTPFDPANPAYYFYEIRLVGQDVHLTRFGDLGATDSFDNFATPDPALGSDNPRVLARSNQDRWITNLTFSRRVNAVTGKTSGIRLHLEMEGKSRGANLQEVTLEHEVFSAVDIPYYSANSSPAP